MPNSLLSAATVTREALRVDSGAFAGRPASKNDVNSVNS